MRFIAHSVPFLWRPTNKFSKVSALAYLLYTPPCIIRGLLKIENLETHEHQCALGAVVDVESALRADICAEDELTHAPHLV